MGQKESKTAAEHADSNDYVADASHHHDELLRHYGNVHVDSGSEYSTTTTNTPRHPYVRHRGDVTNTTLLSEEEVLIDLDRVVDALDSGDVASRTESRDFSDHSFPSTSTDRILEDYAEYANELINAPYNLRNQYTSNETINSRFNEENETNRRKRLSVRRLVHKQRNNYLDSVPKGGRTDSVSGVDTDSVYVNVPEILITDYDSKRNNCSASSDATTTVTSASGNRRTNQHSPSTERATVNDTSVKQASPSSVHAPLQRQRCVVVEVVESADLTSEGGSVGSSYANHNQLPFDTKSRNLGSNTEHLASGKVPSTGEAFNDGRVVKTTNDCVFDSVNTGTVHQTTRPSDKLSEHVSKISVNCEPSVKDSHTSATVNKSTVEQELYDDVIASVSPEFCQNVDVTCSPEGVKSLAKKFEDIAAKSSRDSSPTRIHSSRNSINTLTPGLSSPAHQSSSVAADETEESIYEEYCFRLPTRSRANQTSARRKLSLRHKAVQTEKYLSVRRRKQFKHKGTATESFLLKSRPDNMVFNRKNKKSDTKRSRHKSDSSTSLMSDSSLPAAQGNNKQGTSKKSKKRSKAEKSSGVVEQWGSMITEYEQKFVPEDSAAAATSSGKKHVTATTSSEKQYRESRENREQFENVRQLYNRGMVLPIKRAPPGLTAQELESESGATDMSANSWSATMPVRSAGSARVQNGGFANDDLYERGRVGRPHTGNVGNANHRAGDSRFRLSSQSSQYTSDAPLFRPASRANHVIQADVHRAHAQDRRRDGDLGPEYSYSNYRSGAGDYSSLPLRRNAYYPIHEPFPAHRDSLNTRYNSLNHNQSAADYQLRNRRNVRMHSGYSTTPEIQRRSRYVTNDAPLRYRANNSYEHQSRSMTRGGGGGGADRSISPRRYRAVSVPRDVAIQRNQQQQQMSLAPTLKTRSQSVDYLDYDSAPVGAPANSYTSSARRSKVVKFNGKKSSKKTLDQKAKGVVDDIIDEAIDLLSPRKSRKRSKSKTTESRQSRSRSRQSNVVHTTNVFNEFREVDSSRGQLTARQAARAYTNRELMEMENRRLLEESQAIQDYEDGLREARLAQAQQRSLLRPARLDIHSTEYRSSIRPVPGSGVTRDGSAPPPRSAYRNYDFELSVGQSQDVAQGQNRANMYSSDSEFSAGLYPRKAKTSRYPNVTFGPTRSRSVDHLLSPERPKAAPHSPKRSLKSTGSTLSKSTGYESEPSSTRHSNAPTLSRGVVTKVTHTLDDDVKTAATSRGNNTKPSLQSARLDHSSNTWSHSQPDSGHYGNDATSQWTNLSSPSMYSPVFESSVLSPAMTSNYQSEAQLSPCQPRRVDSLSLGTETHARFTQYHGEKQPINISIPSQYDSSSLRSAGATTANQSKYGAFSNEQMIVAELVNNELGRGAARKQQASVTKQGRLFGTQPDVTMNKQQPLNLFLFNQPKTDNEAAMTSPPQDWYDDVDDALSVDFQEEQSPRLDSEMEMREYLINHKGTQTRVDAAPARKHKKKERTKYIIVQQPLSPPPQQIETTHYVTQQREIEKMPPMKHRREMSIQTEAPKKKPKEPRAMNPSFTEVQSYVQAPVFTETRHMEKKNYEPSAHKLREIPIVYEQPLEPEVVSPAAAEHVEEVYRQVEKQEPSDDEETVILETTEVEEKEQRIQMAIFEEYEFSHKRTEDGKTVSVGGPDGQESDIPIFWKPDKWEVVVDKKKKKSTQVKETTQEDEHKKCAGPTDDVTDHVISNQQVRNNREPIESQQPVAVVTRPDSTNLSDTFTAEANDNLKSLEHVLEKELAQKKQGPTAERVQQHEYEAPDESGRMQEKSYLYYEKEIPIDVKTPSTTGKSFKSQKTLFLSPTTQRKKASQNASATSATVAASEPTAQRNSGSSRDVKANGEQSSSKAYTYTQYTRNDQPRRTTTNRPPAYHDSYLSLFSAKPYSPNRVYGRDQAISNNWKERVWQAEADPSNPLNSHYTQQLQNGDEVDGGHEAVVPTSRAEFTSAPTQVSSFVGESHTQQSGPVAKTHYETDADGNRVKVTEWEHTLTKTVAHPSDGVGTPKTASTIALNKLPEEAYMDMNLHETAVVTKSETESVSSDNTDASSRHRRAPAVVNEVTGETEVGRKAFYYDTQENTMNIKDSDDELRHRNFLYDIRRAQLRPVSGSRGKVNRRVYGGQTMSTQL